MEKYYPPKYGGVTMILALALLGAVLYQAPWWLSIIVLSALALPKWRAVWGAELDSYLVNGLSGHNLLLYFTERNSLCLELSRRNQRDIKLYDRRAGTPFAKIALGGLGNKTGFFFIGCLKPFHWRPASVAKWKRAIIGDYWNGRDQLEITLKTEDVYQLVTAEELRYFLEKHRETSEWRYPGWNPDVIEEIPSANSWLREMPDICHTNPLSVLLELIQHSPRAVDRTVGEIIAEQAEVAV